MNIIPPPHPDSPTTRAFLIGLRRKESSPLAADAEDAEAAALAASLGVEVAAQERAPSGDGRGRFGVGSGKAQELAEKAAALGADCLIFDWELSPSQQRNWEDLGSLPVMDRTELIIRIFASRAQTREAALQVELARLSYALPRLSHKYLDLSRQRGGSYGTRGAGETRLETDRRALRDRIQRLRGELAEVRKNRELQRKKRGKALSSCALVGYTNAGKSSLLNALTGAALPVEDKLFATLDPAARLLPGRTPPLVLIDTVGFIRRLPHTLVDAFRATLEEASLADFLIHVLDASDPGAEGFFTTTMEVLRELGADQKPMILALNKADRGLGAPGETAPGARPWDSAGCPVVAVSAKTGQGIPELLEALEQLAPGELRWFRFPLERGDLAALVHRQGRVRSERCEGPWIEIAGQVSAALKEKLRDYLVDGPLEAERAQSPRDNAPPPRGDAPNPENRGTPALSLTEVPPGGGAP